MSVQMTKLFRILLLVVLLISVCLNVVQAYRDLDIGITLSYYQATIDYATSDRDIAVVICNQAFLGGSKEEVIAAGEALGGASFEKTEEYEGVIVGQVRLIFEEERLVRIDLGFD